MVHKGHAAAGVIQICVVHAITMVTCRPRLQLGAMSGSLGLKQPGSGMTFMASVATEDCVDVQVMLVSKGHAEARVIQI